MFTVINLMFQSMCVFAPIKARHSALNVIKQTELQKKYQIIIKFIFFIHFKVKKMDVSYNKYV
jgi:hypothetical protein